MPSKATRGDRAEFRRLRPLVKAVSDAQAALDRISACPSTWPGDPREPGYEGTRCQRLDDGHAPGTHRHRVLGSQVVLTW